MDSNFYAGKNYLNAIFYIFQLLPIVLVFVFIFTKLTLYEFFICEITNIGFLLTSNAIHEFVSKSEV
jgi:hypothetical protein